MQKKIFIIIISIITVAIAGALAIRLIELNSNPVPQPANLNTASQLTITQGKKDAPVVITVYEDLLCDDCARAHREILPRIIKEYVSTGKVQLHYKLLGTFGPESLPASNAAYCAHEQGKFFDFIDAGFAAKQQATNSSPFTTLGLTSIARTAGVEISRWTHCLDSKPYSEQIAAHKQEVLATGGYGTPHFIINGKGYNGAPPYDIFVPVITAALAEKGVR